MTAWVMFNIWNTC